MNKIKRLFFFLATFLMLAGMVYAVEQRISLLARVPVEYAEKFDVPIIEKRCLAGNQVELFTTTSGTNLQWQKDGADISGETTSVYKPTQSGDYTLKVDDVVSNEIALNFNAPTASFTQNSSSNACGTETVAFTNTSSNGDTYLWEFGDGQTSTDKNPIHKFTANYGDGIQSFNVKLTVTSAACKISLPFEQLIKINRLPDMKLGGTGFVVYDDLPYFRICTNDGSSQFRFYNESSTRSTNISYKIDWGDGTTAFESSSFNEDFILHTFPVGLHKILYTIKGTNGCIDTKEYYVFVGSNPAGNIVPRGNTVICAGQTLTFDILGIADNPPGTQYKISFDDGSVPIILTHPLTDSFVTHTFNTNSCGVPRNNFTVTFEASNPCDSTPGSTGGIYVSDKPKAQFIKNSQNIICENTSVRFTSNSKHNIALPSGCSEGKLIWIVEPLNGSPSDGFSSASNFGNYRGSPDNPADWSTGGKFIDVNFTKTGVYKISLRVAGSSASGTCGPDLYSEEICVNPKPIASFTLPATSSCAPFAVRPTNTSNTPLCGTNTYEWSVTRAAVTDCDNAGTFSRLTSTLENPTFNLTLPGSYTISLTTKNSDGLCSATSSQTVTVKAPPTAVISTTIPAAICEGASINPTALVKNCYGNDAASYEWEFPGASTPTSSLASPINIVYPTKGTYAIRLKVSNECGSSAVYTRNITVNEAPILNPLNDITVCNGTVVPITNFNTSTTGAASYRWTNSNTAINLAASGNGSLPAFTARNNGSTPITATITVTPTATSGNCAGASRTFTITVNPGVATPTAGATQNLCGVTTTTLDGSVAALGGEWSQTSGPTTALFVDKSDPRTQVTGLQAGAYVFKWTVNGYAPCGSSSATVNVTISPLTIGGTTSGANSFCGTGTGSITLSGQVGNVIRWESSLNESIWTAISNVTTTLNYSNLNATTYYRAVLKSGACNQEYSTVTKIQVTPIPPVPTATLNYIYCLNEPATQLTATGTDLKWYKALPLNSTNLLTEAPTPVTSAATTLAYYVTQTIDGCESNYVTITVRVNPSISNNSISGDQTICLNGTPSPLRNSGAALAGGSGSYVYQWQSSTNGTDFTDITVSGNNLNYQPAGVDGYYRRIVTSGTCSSTSNVVRITVQGELTGINISANQTTCYGTAPSKLIGEIPTGGSGTFNYVWQQSTTSANTGFTTISGAADADYQPATLTQTTYYKRIVSSGS